MKLLVVAGQRCEVLMETKIRNVLLPMFKPTKSGAWGFIAKKEARKTPEESSKDAIGDSWCWIALERASKLVLAFAVGRRTLDKAMEFALKIRKATCPDSRFQLTTDSLNTTWPPLMNASLTVATSPNS